MPPAGKPDSNQIVGRERLHFADNQALRSYYEEKYQEGGYEEGGYVQHGVDVSALYHARRMAVALDFLAPGPEDCVLDAGCGKGRLSAEIAPRCRELHSIDIAANALDPRYRAIPNLHFRAMNIEALDFPAARFDGIVSVETLEHVLHPERALAELARVLKPQGRLVLTYPTINRTLVKRWRLAPLIPISEHLNEWNGRELLAAAQAAGLAPRRLEGIAFDFGPVNILKKFNRFFALNLTRAALAIRRVPSNSMFVAVEFRKR